LVGTNDFGYLEERVRQAALGIGIREPTPPQILASPRVARGENLLVVAPTGSGKTEAAMLPILGRVVNTPNRGRYISVLYITPLRALNRDMFKRLRDLCIKLGLTVDVRHGDTPAKQRSIQSSTPPDVLVTTPETLQAVLPGRRMRQNLSGLQAVVVDELHQLVESKRGEQLAVGLERLKQIAPGYQLVALSATIGTPDIAADYIFGKVKHDIVVTKPVKVYDFSVTYPTPGEEDYAVSEAVYSSIDLASRLSTIDSLIEAHGSTLIFVNSRTMAEMLGEKLGRLRKDVGVHHGSLPREERERVERDFREGKLKALVCTSTLELGIDIGLVELVILYMSPRQVTALVQRVGRAGHSLSKISRGVTICVSAEDVLESCAAIIEAREGRLERTEPYYGSLDVLAHQLAGFLLENSPVKIDEVLSILRRTAPYHQLKRETLLGVTSFLSGIGKLRVEGDLLFRSRGTREYYYRNLSTIPDETRYLVVDIATNERVGILGEEFVLLQVRVGIHIILKGRVWQVEKIADDRRIYVTSVDDPLAAVPGWDGEMIPLPMELAKRVGRLRRDVADAVLTYGAANATTALSGVLPADSDAIGKVVEEIEAHMKSGAPLPSDNLILVEGFGNFLILHLCFGERVNRTFGFAFEELLSRRGLVRRWWMDGYRILFELTTDTEEVGIENLARQLFSVSPAELEELYAVASKRNFPFPSRVKTVAERFGAIPKGKYISHPNLCSLPTRFESTPIFEEAVKETNKDLIDMQSAKNILSMIGEGSVKVFPFQSKDSPTPLAYHILYKYLDLPEAVAPDNLVKNTVQRMKLITFGMNVRLICMKCGNFGEVTTVGKLKDEPRCEGCGSGLLAPLYWPDSGSKDIVRKKLSSLPLTDEETVELSRLRRCADLVLSYGKKAVIALSVYGIGPQTASRILAKMQDSEDEFYKSLLDAKLRFITTRQFWQD
jgi:ATP-dependent Lhr-like helicase